MFWLFWRLTFCWTSPCSRFWSRSIFIQRNWCGRRWFWRECPARWTPQTVERPSLTAGVTCCVVQNTLMQSRRGVVMGAGKFSNGYISTGTRIQQNLSLFQNDVWKLLSWFCCWENFQRSSGTGTPDPATQHWPTTNRPRSKLPLKATFEAAQCSFKSL